MGELKIRLDKAIEARLADAGKESGKSPEELVRLAISGMLDELDELSVAQRRFDQIEQGSAATIKHDDLMRKLGIAD